MMRKPEEDLVAVHGTYDAYVPMIQKSITARQLDVNPVVVKAPMEKRPTKLLQAQQLFESARGKERAEVIELLVHDLKLSKACATTYYAKIKKQKEGA